MSNSWTNGKSRCLINCLVNSSIATWFLKLIDASDMINKKKKKRIDVQAS